MARAFPFSTPASLKGLGIDAIVHLAALAGDIAIVLGADGRIVDVALPGADIAGRGRQDWIGQNWAATATAESRLKIVEMIAEARSVAPPRWRRINHPTANGDVPVRYLVVGGQGSDHLLAVGVDISAMSVLEQQLIQSQQALERDHLRLRQAEARYRLLLDFDGDPMIVVDAKGRRVLEANPAAHKLAHAKPGTLVNRSVVDLFAKDSQEDIVALIGAAVVCSDVAPAPAVLADGSFGAVQATAFREDRTVLILLRIAADSPGPFVNGSAESNNVLDSLPDAVAATDERLCIAYANAAFLDLVREAAIERVVGQPLGKWLGRAGIDVDLVAEQVRQYGVARTVAMIARTARDTTEEIEVSAAATNDRGFAFSIRPVGRRIRDLPPAPQVLPRSPEQLAELVGRMSLKEIVRESCDAIERLCIEAALEHTSDNRASAAEILGLSRQSLYSKLHRYRLGNLEDNDRGL